MGKYYVDLWSTGHFLCGIGGSIAFFRGNPLFSLVFLNLGHLLMELTEKTYNPRKNNVVLENWKNHIGDCLFYLVGSILGLYMKPCFTNATLVILIGFAHFFFVIQGFGREIFPDTWWYEPAYHTW